MINKFIKLFAIVTTVFLILGGCGSQSGSGAGGGGSNDGEVQTLEMWTRESSRLNVEAAVKAFNSQSEDIQVELTAFPNANFTDQFTSALASGTGPDLMSLDLVFAPYFSSIGALRDLTPLYESLDYNDQLMDSMLHAGTYEDKKFALPFSADVSALFYNKDHFEEAGLDPETPPETWSELKEYAEQLTTDDKYGYTFAGADVGGQVFTFLPYIWGNGGAVLNDSGTEALINSPEAIEALDFYVDLTREAQVTPEGVPNYSWSQSQDAFTSGKASMIVTGNFFPLILDTDHPDINWGIGLIPKNEGKSHSSFAGGELITIPTSSEHPEAAEEFIKFALSEEVQVEVFAKAGSIPVREDLFENQYFNEEPRYQVFTEALKVGDVPYSTEYNQIFSEPVLGSIQRALNGEVTPQEAFENAEKEINNILND